MPRVQIGRFFFALAVVVAIVITLGVTVKPTASPPPEPITRQIMRRKDRSKQPASTSEIAELRSKAHGQEKKNIRIREFKDMPLKVQAIRNLDSETWHKDLQIEVKNVGTKPIYSILAYLEFLDEKDKVPGNGVSAIILRYGERKYLDITVDGDPQDAHLNPGDTYVFTIEEKYKKGLAIRHERSPESFKHMEFRFNLISFGDRTGFEVGDPTDYRNVKKPSGDGKKHHAGKIRASPTSVPQDGCGSCGRYIIDLEPRHYCYDQYLDQFCDSDGSTTVSWAKCRDVRNVWWDCNGHGEDWCHSDEVFEAPYCPGYTPPSPTPTPSPSPSPTCDPATKPNNTNCFCDTSLVAVGIAPQWSCLCSYTDSLGIPALGIPANHVLNGGSQGSGGCPGFSANNGNDCCICTLNSSDCPEGTHLDNQVCNWRRPGRRRRRRRRRRWHRESADRVHARMHRLCLGSFCLL